MMKRLRNPHLPGIADVIEQGDSLLIVMDYVKVICLFHFYIIYNNIFSIQPQITIFRCNIQCIQ